jgi:exopolyphosphatase/guanosine-5'-triphosphate,3'-diphosphate pyrophosphatase
MTTAVLDFGTNVFNLLIAERKARSFQILHTSKQPVKLGRGGIEANRITADAMERGYVAIQNHLETIARYEVDDIRAFATSAIRNASNGERFTDEVYRKFGIRTRVIPGEREAELIYKGVRQAVDFHDDHVLILDIGGGSNEFILCNHKDIIWKKSFEMGMARVLELFTLSDPISPEEIRALESYFREKLLPLQEAVRRFRPRRLIGAAGSFDTFSALIRHRKGLEHDHRHGREISLHDYRKIHQVLLHSTCEQRRAMPGMEAVRVEMIVAATIFVSFVIRSCQIRHLHHSEFSLKEGVVSELVGL